MSIISEVVSFVKGWHLERILPKIKKSSEDIWKKLSPAVQETIIQSAKVMAVFNTAIAFTPDAIKQKIFSAVPGLTEEKLTELMAKTAKVMNIGKEVIDPNLEVMIANMQEHVKTLGPEWEGYSESFSSWIAFYSTPDQTTFTIISGIIKFVYENFVKGKI